MTISATCHDQQWFLEQNLGVQIVFRNREYASHGQFFFNSWLPLIFESNGLTAQQSGIAISVYHYGGMIGGLLVSVLLGRFGFMVIATLFTRWRASRRDN